MKFDKAKFIYNSNAIEGVDTPLKEVEKAIRLNESKDQHILNHLKAFEYVDKLEHPLTTPGLMGIHQRLSHKILDKKDCGTFRKCDVTVGPHSPPNWRKVSNLVNDLLSAVNTKKDPWLCHMEFEYIHPFIDFNGRTGRMLLYWQEKSQGKDPQTILSEGRHQNYYSKIIEYDTRERPMLWKIKVWRKTLTRNESYVCTQCGTHHEKVIKKCGTCGNADESKFQIYTEAPPFVGPIV